MDVTDEYLGNFSKETSKYKSTSVNKHLEVEYDLGALLVIDRNELKPKLLSGSKEHYLLELTRDNTQLLFNRIWELPTERRDEAILARLPPRRTTLPRFKPIPKPKPLTKWQQFAKEKGIKKKKNSKLDWDDQLKKWLPMFGYRRTKAQEEKDWVLEVPENSNPMEDQFSKKAEAKSERVAKNELQRLRNIAKARRIKLPRVGIPDIEKASSKELAVASTVAKASTASLGRFQQTLPQEKEARGVAAITPGASNRKRKLPPVSAQQERTDNLNIVESVLNKRPKLDINKAVSRHINEEQVQRQEEKSTSKTRSNKNKNRGGKTNKKPKSGKNQRKGGKGSSGRKRR